ncbi:MAG: 50S ribosomal protein L17 [Limnochordaceae bacterium]|uniref:Large ribosomal subunit protein bL17 n=1 Tax=Carboxydichorda subterranea TaxID=3109565 RepID=A0ABZ1C0A8_9FIRM|nr:50S ribosomal protein L17 [Limnochorda sp. L945t]MBE3599006.1 50S ribosomal protein L17 [Limnochordaceae bacterium]WRP17743.1 50S ribosomal protein L17 [Limnochorda sp. L945t]
MKARKLDRRIDHRRWLFRHLVTQVVLRGRVRTTLAKAKAVRPIAEHMVTLAKRGDLHARRQAAAFLTDREALRKLFAEVGPKYAGRQGGYLRIVRLGPRRGDAAPMSIIEWV